MSDPFDFEPQFEARLRAHADRAVRPIDAGEMASIVASRAGRGPAGRPPTVAAAGQFRTLWIAVALVATLVAALGIALLTAGRQPAPALVDAAPSASTMSPTVRAAVDARLRQPWVADQPASLSFDGKSGPRQYALEFDADGTAAAVRVAAVARLASTVEIVGPAEMWFTTSKAGDAVSRDGSSLGGCEVGDVGRYRWVAAPDGATLSLEAILDACRARANVLTRTWSRSLTGDSLGGRGVVDAFAPSFLATVPDGTYATIRTPDAIEIWAADQSVGLLAWKDPQGFVDPCDPAAGRYAIDAGADAFVDYFRQDPGFTVVSADPTTIGDYPATHLVVEARTDHPCPSGWLVEWQPKAESTDYSWHLAPGQRDSVFIVERPDATVLLQVLEAPAEVEAAIVSSVAFVGPEPPASPSAPP